MVMLTVTASSHLSAVIDAIRAEASGAARIVFVSGDFNVIHPGHQRIMSFAAECGDFLVAGVNGDGLGNTILPENLRCQGVASLSVVDYAFILHVPPEEFINALRPAVVVKGTEHRSKFNVEQRVVDSYGGKLLFCSGDTSFSSFDLLQRELQNPDFSAIRLPTNFPDRHGFSVPQLFDVIRRFSSLRVVVVGDLIVDAYVECEPLGMSREDPTLVVTPVHSKQFVGGAGIVAAHAKGLGAEVAYFGVAGEDDAAEFARQELKSHGVEGYLVSDENRPTTLKTRYRAANKTLLRVSHLRQYDISGDLIASLMAKIEAALDGADLLIFSDFNYGCLPQALVDRISEVCKQRKIPVVADSQASSQIGDVSRFHNTLLLTPTEHEARLALRDSRSGLVVLADSLLKKTSGGHVIITLGGEGILIHSPLNARGLITDRLPAFNVAPKDVSGAGDSLLTCTAMALVAGADIWRSGYLGAAAAACQVSRIGNVPLTANDLIRELSR